MLASFHEDYRSNIPDSIPPTIGTLKALAIAAPTQKAASNEKDDGNF